jgi:hypothetical protein
MKLQYNQFILLYILIIHFSLYAASLPGNPAENGQPSFDWNLVSFPYDENICQAIMFDSANGWVSTNFGSSLFRLMDGKWYSVPTPAQYRNLELFGFAPNNIWIACFDKITYRHLLRRFDGQQWHTIYTLSADRIRAMDYLAPNNIWGAGE